MEKKHTILEWILGFFIIFIIGYISLKIEKLSEYFVEIINPSGNKNLYRDIGSGIIILITGLCLFGLSIKLREDSFLQKLSTSLFMLNAFVFIFYLFYLLIRIIGSF